METSEDKRVIYEFEGFVLDTNERTLTVNGTPIQLPAKEFETLLYLVEHGGRAVTKEELMSAVWQDAFVEESNLAKQISRLRKLLGGGGTDLIETIPKRGYRLKVTDVRVREPDPLEPVVLEKRTVKRMKVAFPESTEEPALALQHPPAPPTGIGRRGLWWSIPLLLIVAAALLTYFWVRAVPDRAADPKVRSIAVLPFKLAGSGSDDEYLRVGLTDAVVTKLSGLKQIVVRPAHSVRGFAAEDPLAAGRALGVDVVLDGTIQRVDQQIRLTVQLIGVRDGTMLWGGKFDEDLTNIFALQDAISEQVARTIAPDITVEEQARLTRRFTTSHTAHDAYVRGRVYWNRRTAADLKEAAKYFETAIKEDPNYALAYAGLADTYTLLGDYRGLAPAEAYEKAKVAALKALQLDNTLAEAHTSLAYVRMYYYWDWPGAENSYRQAIELNPNYATARQWYSEYLTAMGRFDEAVAEIRRAREIDPLSPIINSGEVWILYYARRYDEAIERSRRITEMNPEFAEIYEYLKRVYDQKGMYREAIASRQMRRKLAGLDPVETPAIERAAEATDPMIYWRARLEQELLDSRTEPPSTFDMAEIYAQLGEKDKAFEWLEKAFEERIYLMMYLRVAPNLDPLRSEPEYIELVRRVGL